MEIVPKKRLLILSGSYHLPLAQAVAAAIGVELGKMKLAKFANGEISCKIDESARGADVFVFATHGGNVNEAILEQAIIIDAAKRASAKRITAVSPFFGYARQDRKSSGREPITAKLIVDVLAVAGADRIVSVDLHSGQIQGFFDGPFDHLTALPVLADYAKKQWGTRDLVIVSPDAGRVKTAERYTQRLGADLVIVHKTRSKTQANTVEAKAVIGEVRGRCCVLIDDMIDTAGTIVAAADLLKARGAAEIHVLSTHGLFSGPAVKRLEASPVDSVVVTDTLPLGAAAGLSKLHVVSLAPLIAAAVKAIFYDESVSRLFGGENHI